MSGPAQSLADPMSTYNASRRFFQEERKRQDAARSARVSKKCEKALDRAIKASSKSECTCNCQCEPEKLSPQEIQRRKNLLKRLDAFDRKCREEHTQFIKEIQKGFSCTIL